MFDLEYKKKELFLRNSRNYYFIALFAQEKKIKEMRLMEFSRFLKKPNTLENNLFKTFSTLALCVIFRSILIAPAFLASTFYFEHYLLPSRVSDCYFCQRAFKSAEITQKREAIIIDYIAKRTNSADEFESELDRLLEEYKLEV